MYPVTILVGYLDVLHLIEASSLSIVLCCTEYMVKLSEAGGYR
jgi:hypothetical protein